jgi:hypothetical protein
LYRILRFCEDENEEKVVVQQAQNVVPLWALVQVVGFIFQAAFGAMGQFNNLKPTTSDT